MMPIIESLCDHLLKKPNVRHYEMERLLRDEFSICLANSTNSYNLR